MEVSREEAKRILRRLELDAYSSIVSTFRAQGDLNREKKRLLTDLGVHLSISTERHRAEVRRAYSDDRLGAVAECIVGPSSCSEWAAEGRRLVPLMPRLVPQTVLSGTATASANTAAASNAQVVQTKKVVGSSAQSSKEAVASSMKQSPTKPLARQSSETVDVEYDSDDNKSKKKRKLSQSLTTPKPVQKISLNSSMVGNKLGAKTSSVSTSTMTKTGKPSTSPGTIKATQKLVLPASQSQVKLLTKTVSITQTISQAKTMLNYKTVAATNPAAVKVQTVTSHNTPKAQVKTAMPSKNVLVPKASGSTNTTKAASSISPIKTGILSQLVSKQRGKQPARFKPLPGAVKFKSVNALAMGIPSTPVTVATPTTNITNLTGSTVSTASSTQPVVRVIQVPGATSSTTGKTVPSTITTTNTSKPSTTPMPVSSAITKIPISTTQSQANRLATTSTVPSAPKTVVMTTIVGGSKKVLLSVPATVTPVQGVPSGNINKPTKTTGVTSQSILNTGDGHNKPDKQDTKTSGVPSLECTEPSSVLQAPIPIVPKQAPVQVLSSQVRRPLQTLLPAPPKPVAVTAATTISSSTVVRKLPQILPAPAKTTVMLPVTKPNPTISTTGGSTSLGSASSLGNPASLGSVASLGNTVTLGNSGKVPLVQFVAKSTQPTMVTKLCVAKTVPVVSTQVVSAPGTLLAQPGQQMIGVSKTASTQNAGHSPLREKPIEKDENKTEGHLSDTTASVEKDQVDCDDNKTDNNTSSEDDSLLVCSETIDSGAGLQEMSSKETTQETLSTTPGNILAMSTPLKQAEQSNAAKEIKEKTGMEKQLSGSTPPTVPLHSNPKVVVEVLDNLDTQQTQFNAKDHFEVDEVNDDLVKNNTIVNEHEDDKSGNGEDFDAVSSFLEMFAIDQSEESANTTGNEFLVNKINITQDNDVKDIKNACSTNIEKPVIHNSENAKTTLSGVSDGTSSILSDFDFLGPTKIIDSEAGKNYTDTSDSCTLYPNAAPTDKTDTLCQVISEFSCTGSSLNSENLKEFPLDESSSNSSIHTPQNTNILENSSTQMSNTISASLNLSNNETVATSSSSGQELTEREKLELEAIANVRTSSRKRKPPSVLTLSPPRQTSGWVRGALSLLQKVCSYRGQGRKKGDYSAASWFLRPVDPNEAPGYFKVIKNPMDLSTIKTKLESGAYRDYVEFHEDMVLIKTNCFKYNPPGHDIWKDCEEVFNYFDAEYEKMLERWEKCHVSPAKKPRPIPKQELAQPASW